MTDYVRDAAQDLLAACEAAVDDDPCRLDHHGYCQTHLLGNPCENALMRAAIAKARRQTCPRCLGNKTGWSRKARSYIKCSECKGKGWIP